MKLWIVSVGEPLPVDGENTRLRRMGNLATFSSQHGIKVDWFSVSFDHYKKTQRCQGNTDFLINDNFTLRLVDSIPYKRNVSFKRIKHHKQAGVSILKRMKSFDKPDVIIASMEPLEVSKVAVEYAKEYNIPCVIDVRDLWPEIYYDVIPKSFHWLLNFYVKRCAKTLNYTMSNCDSIIGLSEGFLNYGLKYARRERQETDLILPIGYPNYNYVKNSVEFEECWGKYNLKESDFIITFLGNFGDQFKFDEIIQVSKTLIEYKNIKFVLCGNGKNQAKIESMVGENVIIPGWIEKKQIVSLLYNSKMGIAPYIDSMNYRLNTPNKFGEYLSAGLPIVVSVSGEMESLLMKNQCGAKYDNAEDLKNLILKYYDSKEEQEKASKNAKALYLDMFNADDTNEKFISHINKIIKKKVGQ